MAEVDRRFYGAAATAPTRGQVLERYRPYVERKLSEGVRLHQMTRHILGLFQGQPGARAFRRHLSERAVRPGADANVLREAAQLVADPGGGTTRVAAE